jgi:predicted nucleic acid-binding protein
MACSKPRLRQGHSVTKLRVILGQRDKLREWKSIERGVASALVQVECLRTLDRLRLRAGLSDEYLAERRQTVFRIIDETEVVEPSMVVLDRAARPFPTELGTLDAIHLATALMWRESRGEDIVMATHDRALGTAARARGLEVVGVKAS